MRFLAKLFFRGLAAILPLALTGYLVYYAVNAGEALLSSVVGWLFPNMVYRPGMGWAVSIVLVMAVGLLMYTVVARVIYAGIARLLNRIPIVKSIYGMVVDVVRLVGSGEKRQFGKVVLVRLQGTQAELLGFVTRETFDDMPQGFAAADHVAVYLPMSYQLGGFTVVVPRSNVRPVRMSGEEAVRWAVTAGVAPSQKG